MCYYHCFSLRRWFSFLLYVRVQKFNTDEIRNLKKSIAYNKTSMCNVEKKNLHIEIIKRKVLQVLLNSATVRVALVLLSD